jgi:hypothetical protein
MLKGEPTLAVPVNVPVPTFCTVKLLVALVPVKIVPYAMLPGVTWITGVSTTGAFVALPVTVVFVPAPPVKVTFCV